MKELLLEARTLGVEFELKNDDLHVTAPKGVLTSELRDKLKEKKSDIVELLRAQHGSDEVVTRVESDAENWFQPFPLTDLQNSYWLGRVNSIDLGNIATHVYLEIEGRNIDVVRLNEALCRLIERHGMLRMVIDVDGMQRVLPTVPEYKIDINDQSHSSQGDAERSLEALRAELSHQVKKTDQWPLFDIRGSLLPGELVRLHLSIDMLVMDASSFASFFSEWHQLYLDANVNLTPLALSFRDYVCGLKLLEGSPRYIAAKDYWMNRLETIPAAPELPLKVNYHTSEPPRFTRRSYLFGRDKWARLKKIASERGITASGLLMASYSEVVARWSEREHFTLNVIISNRQQLHEDVNKLLGVFTSVVMQEVDRRDDQKSFQEFAAALQRQSAQDMQHRDYSGVIVMREWARQRGISMQAVMPVVFNSALVGVDNDDGTSGGFGEQVYSSAQTSQVYLENHISERNGDLHIAWESIDAVFEEGVLDAMFEAYSDLVERLVEAPELWDEHNVVRLPAKMQSLRDEANNTLYAMEEHRLHTGLIINADANPQSMAVISAARSLTYDELLAEACGVANWLLERKINSGQPVAIIMKKGWEQIVAVYGVLIAGGAYMPINEDLPLKRKLELMRIGGVTRVLTQSGVDYQSLLADGGVLDQSGFLVIDGSLKAGYDERHRQILQGDSGDLAYVIFTSGTTGVPKGVMIDHRGAMNTIENVNRLFGITASDKALAVSSLSFDLSVYDIFGLHFAGGALVIPDESKGHDPAHWLDLIEHHQVTLWNSAPQLMSMLMDNAVASGNTGLPLTTVMMSGDWIPLGLPGNIKKICSTINLISLGGATEASIWSNYFAVDQIDPEWNSIPYGKPLPNQTMRVYDHDYQICPDLVVGGIYIGGMGLALGYWGDEELTSKKFVHHPETGERLYDTGDLGQYDSEGNIIILGRADRQVKIRGYRIELDEIESVMNEVTGIKRTLVVCVSEPQKQNKLAAYVQLADAASVDGGINGEYAVVDVLKEYLEDRLPDYMVPQYIVPLESIPLSSNGKVDYKSLPIITSDIFEQEYVRLAPRNEREQEMLNVWLDVLGDEDIGVTDSFFEFGGDSITAAQLVREVNTAFSTEIEMHEFFENPTIEELVALISEDESSRVPSGSGPRINTELMLQDVQDAVTELDAIDISPYESRERRNVLVTGATGWLGAHVLAELLSSTDVNVFCMVRSEMAGNDVVSGLERIKQSLTQYGVKLTNEQYHRVHVVVGDLEEQRFGLSDAEWSSLVEVIDAIYHLGADLSLANDYATARKANVIPLVDILKLATQDHLKPVYFASPMNVCMRYENGHVEVDASETPVESPDGLLTGYSQSKWVGERVLLAASDRGLPVKIYRSSHALPSTRNGYAKSHDTFVSLFQLACSVALLPDWDEAYVHGLPVDLLAHLLVKDSLESGAPHAIVHVDNPDAPSFKSVLGYLIKAHHGDSVDPDVVPFQKWRELCRKRANETPTEGAALAKTLVMSHGPSQAPIEHMFGGHAIDVKNIGIAHDDVIFQKFAAKEYWQNIVTNQDWSDSQ